MALEYYPNLQPKSYIKRDSFKLVLSGVLDLPEVPIECLVKRNLIFIRIYMNYLYFNIMSLVFASESNIEGTKALF